MTVQQKKNNIQIRFGLFLMIFSGVFLGASFIIPLFDFEAKTKVILVSTS